MRAINFNIYLFLLLNFIPLSVKNVDENILVPRNTWSDKESYDLQAKKLVEMFSENFAIYESHVDSDIIEAAPKIS